MSGIMEAILGELQAIRLALSTGPALSNGGIQQQQPAATDAFGMPVNPAPTTPANVTEAQVMALIEPHLENAPLKAGLQAVLAAMGIARLPEARPDQYVELYTKFQSVIAQHAAAPGAVGSII
jgi:hypothetical protein